MAFNDLVSWIEENNKEEKFNQWVISKHGNKQFMYIELFQLMNEFYSEENNIPKF